MSVARNDKKKGRTFGNIILGDFALFALGNIFFKYTDTYRLNRIQVFTVMQTSNGSGPMEGNSARNGSPPTMTRVSYTKTNSTFKRRRHAFYRVNNNP